MAASIYTLGPADVFVRFRDQTVYYLGTNITSTDVVPKYYRNDVFNDLGGRNVPFARIDDGVEHEITLSLNRFDLTAYHRIMAFGGLAADRGKEFYFTRGRLHTGVSDFELIFKYVFPQIPIGLPADAPIGRRYFSCTYRTGRETRVGSRAEELTLMVTATPLYDTSTRGFFLYSEDAASVNLGLPAFN